MQPILRVTFASCVLMLLVFAAGDLGASQSISFAVLGPVDPASKISDNIYASGLDATPAGAADSSMVLLNSSSELYVQRLDAKGKRIGLPIAITSGPGFGFGGAMATLTGGRIAVVYDRTPGAFNDMGVYAQLFNPNGSFVATRKVSTIGTHSQRSPAVTALSNGNLVIVWVDNPDAPARAAQKNTGLPLAGREIHRLCCGDRLSAPPKADITWLAKSRWPGAATQSAPQA